MTARQKPELIPRSVRQAVLDAVGGWGPYSVAQIAALFRNEGFEPARGVQLESSGQRRQEAELFQAAIDFLMPQQVQRYLRVIEEIIEDHEGDGAFEKTRRDRLVRALRRSDIELDDKGRLDLPVHRDLGSLSLIDLPTESDIRLHMTRLSRLEQEPEEMIGAAKELVEATVKHVLLELDGLARRRSGRRGLPEENEASRE